MQHLSKTERDGIKTITLKITPICRVSKEYSHQYVPQLKVDQMREINCHLCNMNGIQDGFINILLDQTLGETNVSEMDQCEVFDLIFLEVHILMQGESHTILQEEKNCKKVMERHDWPKFQAAYIKNLDKNYDQNLYSDTIPQKYASWCINVSPNLILLN